VANADDSIEWNQVVERNAEQLAVEEASCRLMKRLVWTQVIVAKRQSLSTATMQDRPKIMTDKLND